MHFDCPVWAYNLFLKHTPWSILPYFFGFPMLPTYIWLSLGGFKLDFLWFIPMIILVSFPAHIANELPDYPLDKKFGKNNFAVAVGEKTATIIYWGAILLGEVLITSCFFIYHLNLWIFLGTLILSATSGIIAFLLLWKNKWKTNLFIFNIVITCIGSCTIGLFTMFNIG